MKRRVVLYCRADGTAPYADWLRELRDHRTQARIIRHVDRMGMGNLGDSKSVGGGVLELRLHFGPGYRVYFALDGDVLVVLLCGGDKGSQRRDIQLAKTCWREYSESGQ